MEAVFGHHGSQDLSDGFGRLGFQPHGAVNGYQVQSRIKSTSECQHWHEILVKFRRNSQANVLFNWLFAPKQGPLLQPQVSWAEGHAVLVQQQRLQGKKSIKSHISITKQTKTLDTVASLYRQTLTVILSYCFTLVKLFFLNKRSTTSLNYYLINTVNKKFWFLIFNPQLLSDPLSSNIDSFQNQTCLNDVQSCCIYQGMICNKQKLESVNWRGDCSVFFCFLLY